ncbi:hypothetical protein TNCV_3409571 [Trichonephila clavipes]|nr:hypothetical protein TNCV_3409571 [Trichonephila clavipes]
MTPNLDSLSKKHLAIQKHSEVFGKLVRWCNTKRPRAPPRKRRWERFHRKNGIEFRQRLQGHGNHSQF